MWLLELSQSSWSRDTISVSDKHKLTGNKRRWEERNRIMKLWTYSPALSLVKPGSDPRLPVTRGPRQLELSGCDSSSLAAVPSGREVGRTTARLVSVSSHGRCCWMAPSNKKSSILSALQTVPSLKSSLNGECERGRTEKLFTFLIPYLATTTWKFLTLIFKSGVFMPIGQKIDKCGLDLANKSIKVFKPSAKKEEKQRHE